MSAQDDSDLVEAMLQRATGLSVQELRNLRKKFHEEGRTSQEMMDYFVKLAAERGQLLIFTNDSLTTPTN